MQEDNKQPNQEEISPKAVDNDVNEFSSLENLSFTNEAESKTQETKPKKKSKIAKFFKFIFILGILGAIIGSVSAYALYQWAAGDLPSFSKITDYRPAQVTTVLARDGSLIGQFYREKRYVIGLTEMAPHVPKAFLAVEDSEFYEHPGVNVMAIVRAFIANMQSGSISQGGSTITQQVVKRLMLTPEKSYERKIKEAVLAYRLEKQLSKDDILTIYLNQIFLGNNAYGIEAAARTYFNKHASQLSIAEAAMLAGLPQSPSAYNPLRYPDVAKTRQGHVLRRMRTLGWISDEEYDTAIHEELVYSSMPTFMGREGGWYLEEVRRQLLEIFNEENAARMGFDMGIFGADVVYEMGLTVYTSMDPVQQHFADVAFRKGLVELSKRQGFFGPVENIVASKMDEYLEDNPFNLKSFEKGEWQKALVVATEKQGASVRIGEYKGYVPVKTMGWARKPNPVVNGRWQADSQKDASLVLKVGDVVWVSLKLPTPEQIKKMKNPEKEFTHLSQLSPDTVMPLALEQIPVAQGALVSMEAKTGDVVAMVGGYEFSYDGDQFNRATQALRQPGSSFKPVVYSAALDYGFTAGSYILDAPILLMDEVTKQVWRPKNFDPSFDGPIRLNRALARSKNLCTVRIAQEMGMEYVLQRAKDLGFKSDLPPYLAVSLGAGEVTPVDMATSYAAFANGGQRAKPRFIHKITGAWGNVIYEQLPEFETAISPENAFVMAKLLQGVVQFGTSTKAKVLEQPVAGKTGTTNGEVDAWFVGFTPDLVTATYVGFDQIQSLGRGETGGGAALPIYIDYAQQALDLYPTNDFVKPDSVYYSSAESGGFPLYVGTTVSSGINVVEGDSSKETQDAENLFMQGM